MWELDYKESWALKYWCFWTVVLEKTLESPLDCKEIQPVNPKGNQSWIFTGRTDAEAETPVLWPPDSKNWLIWKDLDTGKDWRQEEKGMTEDEMVRWHHRLSGHEFEQALGVGEGQGGLACCSPWGRKESDTTEQLNWTELRRGREWVTLLSKCRSDLPIMLEAGRVVRCSQAPLSFWVFPEMMLPSYSPPFPPSLAQCFCWGWFWSGASSLLTCYPSSGLL